ncbi:DoxX family protein [Haloferax mediterranei ATCC 33500]|uniref:DoxX family protein n=1 Tax=Haloferax mediterranei (strain ATCC 33500 / DSM 1411 / JCM 8866 / NBRC 14739 / NCIMB 2177 / R-4) TaxID=523841 RepID=M0J7P7_HALMT|nr:DoxX family protein [Haloferax mediterranei]AHZ21533.1 DoxX family protein [Haloferax mediterranei ATCC 33500]EMA03994.1 DoxX family protein [Haloferax mediterranei ATCC 33500]MDX5989201.1 DoxX family protein [Haloferax mediterranei ATCC 33500]QCQ75578.1 DoxX family protein [Haloferax mediterranei ATCC 33500]
MEDTYGARVGSVRQSTLDWALTGLRLVLAALVAKPALSKFITHGTSVAFFDAIGMPAPTLMVIVAGFIEVGAVVLLLAGVGERLAAFSLIPVMLVAVLYVGPDWKNLSVLVGSLVLLLLERGSGSRSWPAQRLLG